MRSLALLALLSACGASPIVGAECRQGYTQCDDVCVDLGSDPAHCGACGLECDFGESCFAGVCTSFGDASVDAARGDGAVDDGAVDAGVDGSLDAPQYPDADGSTTDGAADGNTDAAMDGSTDGSTDGAMDGSTDGGDGSTDGGDAGSPCPCDLGEQCCGDICVRPASDPDNCGGCGVVCAEGEVCADGSCSLVCEPPLERCGDRCVDTMGSDPDNCGGCGVSCDTGICIEGVCSAGLPGHVVLVGHSYRTSRVAMRRVAGNAVFIPLFGDLDVVVYEEHAVRSMQNGVDRAIDEAAALRGRTWNRIVAPDADSVPMLLDDADVFVVYSQANADDDSLRELGSEWATALMSFLLRGGVVVVFDGGGAHSGTWQVLDAAGLVTVAGRSDISDTNVTLAAPADQVAIGVPTIYRAERESVCFGEIDDLAPAEGVVIRTSDGDAVVIHRVF